MDGLALVQLIEIELKRRHITKGTFYRESGISSATMSQWRNGVYAPSKSAIEAVEKFFGITLTLTQKEKPSAVSSEGFSDSDVRLLEWFRSLPEEKRRAILIASDAPEDVL